MILEFPHDSHKAAYLDMIDEWKNFEAIPTSPGRLFDGETFEAFLGNIQQDTTGNPYGVNSHLFFLIE